MAGLGETIERLVRARRDHALRASPPRPARMKPIADFGDNPGALRMWLYAPPDLGRRPPLVVVVHGCGQRAEAFASDGGWLALARRLGFAVLAPEQGMLNNLNVCFNWFAPDDVTRGQGEAASIAAMVAHAVGLLGLDPERVFVTGLSAGGAMAAALLATYPELFAGGAIIAGIPYGVARSLQDGLKIMQRGDGRSRRDLGALAREAGPRDFRRPLRLSIWQGEADMVVNPVNGRALADQWTEALGLPLAPDEEIVLPRRRRLVWRGAAGVESVVELNLIADLGHGAPLSTLKAGDVGAPAPFMLEAGISSTLEVAGFWGLGAEAAAEPPVKVSAEPAAVARADHGLLGRLRRAVVGAIRAIGLKR